MVAKSQSNSRSFWGGNKGVPLENATEGVPCIDTDHEYIHKGGESSGSAEEWVFAPNAMFTGTLVNGTTAVATVQVNFKWYEEDGY